VQEKCIITTHNVSRLLYHVRHSGRSALRPLGIPALLTLGIAGYRHSCPYPSSDHFTTVLWWAAHRTLYEVRRHPAHSSRYDTSPASVKMCQLFGMSRPVSYFSPQQLGVGTPGRCEAAIHPVNDRQAGCSQVGLLKRFQ